MKEKKELDDRVTFRANHQKWLQFKNECQKYNLPASVVIRQFMDNFGDIIKINDLFQEQKAPKN